MRDDKDWTWVLDRPCPDCGFDASEVAVEDLGDQVRGLVERYEGYLSHPRRADRPDPETWSAAEYICHVRDVYALFTHRLERMLTEHDPLFDNWDQDDTAVAERYDLQDPDAAGVAMRTFGLGMADALDAVADGDWDRPGRRSDGARFTVGSFARYFLHDPVHHAWDIEQGYERLA